MAEKKNATPKKMTEKSLRKDGPTLGEREAGPVYDQRSIDQNRTADNDAPILDRVHTPGS